MPTKQKNRLLLRPRPFFPLLLPRTACHELRNPLHAILATLSFMEEDSALSTVQAEDLSTMILSATHMQRLVNDVLDLAKLREGSLQLRVERARIEQTEHCFARIPTTRDV
jgi:signal transduction histidine kinase